MRSLNDSASTNFSLALKSLGEQDFAPRADCLSGLANIARMQDDNEKARALYEDARELYRRADNTIGVIKCEHRLNELRKR